MMRRRMGTGIGLGFALVTANLMLLASSTNGATVGTLSLDAATFAFRPSSTHAKAPPCVNAIVTPAEATEHDGTIAGKGGFFGSANLPNGATVTSFSLSARDNDGDDNTYAYLLRKRLDQTSNATDGFLAYKVMAQTGSSGASTDLRQFTDTTVDAAVVVNRRYAYFVELVNCIDLIDPIGVQIAYTTP